MMLSSPVVFSVDQSPYRSSCSNIDGKLYSLASFVVIAK
jgi:hypothetical protein